MQRDYEDDNSLQLWWNNDNSFLAEIYNFHKVYKKNKKKELMLTSFSCPSQEIRLDDSWKLVCLDQSKFSFFFFTFHLWEDWKKLQNILNKYYFIDFLE